MEEYGGLENLIRRYRGIWLLLLCVMMFFGGKIQRTEKTIETGNTPAYYETANGEQAVFSGVFQKEQRNVQAILDILKKYHGETGFFLTTAWEDGSGTWNVDWDGEKKK